jgi:hypothetical protein
VAGAGVRRARAERGLLEKNPPPTTEQLEALRTDRIRAALRSPDTLWSFVTSPEPMYLERRAAAIQGKGIIPVEWLPKVWRALGELRHEQRLHDFGLKPHPHSAAPYFGSRAPASPHAILGHPWIPPAQPIDYPLTPQELELALAMAGHGRLRDLNAGLTPGTYAPLERAKADAYLAAVLTMPCDTDEEAQRLVEAVQGSSHYKTPAIMGVLRNIALNPAFTLASTHVSTTFADATRLWDDPRAWPIGSAGVLDILKSTPHEHARENTAYSTQSLRQAFADGTIASGSIPPPSFSR